jgi:hypothetical protein
MKRRTDFLLICASFILGAWLSIDLRRFLFGGRVYSDWEWRFLRPGDYIPFPFPTAYGPGWWINTIFETIVFGGIIYFVVRGVIWLLRRLRNCE